MNASIRRVTLEDVIGLDRYEKQRDEIRRRIIALKKKRRISVGDCVTFVFENHDTVFFQIQEMLRAERITDLDAVRDEVDVYNSLLPRPGELSATMLIEITDETDIESRLLRLLGIDEKVSLEIGGSRVPAMFETGHSREDRISAVQYVRFELSPAAVEAFVDERQAASLRIDHENYCASTAIQGETRRSLVRDLVA